MEQIDAAIENTLGTLSDGANTKIATGILTVFDLYFVAKKNRRFPFREGITEKNIEKTLKNLGTLG